MKIRNPPKQTTAPEPFKITFKLTVEGLLTPPSQAAIDAWFRFFQSLAKKAGQ